MAQIATAIYGYLKRAAAIHTIQLKREQVTLEEILKTLDKSLHRLHDPLTWRLDVERRIKQIQLGEW